MTEISSSNNLIDTDEEIIIETEKPRGRPINPVRHRPDGTYNKQCLDPEYAKRWYHKRFCVPYTCGTCGRTLANDQTIKQHESTAVCPKANKKFENVWT